MAGLKLIKSYRTTEAVFQHDKDRGNGPIFDEWPEDANVAACLRIRPDDRTTLRCSILWRKGAVALNGWGVPASTPTQGWHMDRQPWPLLNEGCTVLYLHVTGRPEGERLRDLVGKELGYAEKT